MKKLLSILAALGMTATASAGVVACGTSDKSSKIVKTDYDDKSKTVTIELSEEPKNAINLESVHIKDTDGNEVGISKVVPTDKKIVITLKDFKEPEKTTTYIVTIDGVNASNNDSFTITVNDASTDTPVWVNDAKAEIGEENNVASFTIDANSKKDSNVDYSKRPTINTDLSNPDVILGTPAWDTGLHNLKMTLKNGLEKKDYKFTVMFNLKNSKGYSEPTILTISKVAATAEESSVKFVSGNNKVTTNSENNNVIWSYASVGEEVDTTKTPEITSDKGFAVIKENSISIDAQTKTIHATLVDGLDKGDYNLKLKVALKNGFVNNNSVDLIATKNITTTSEKDVKWDSNSQIADGKNTAVFTVTSFGKEVNVENDPKVVLEGNKNIDSIVESKTYEKGAHKLTIVLKDGVNKGDYKFDISFSLIGNFKDENSAVKTLTVQKTSPTNVEIQMIPDNAKPVANSENNFTPAWTFKNVLPGIDIDLTKTNGTDKDQSVIVSKVDNTDIKDTASLALVDWDGSTLKFLGASSTNYGSVGTHSVTFEFRQINGFGNDGRVKIVLQYEVPASTN